MTMRPSPRESPEASKTAGIVRCAVLTISDAHSPETDYGGRTVAYLLTHNKHMVVRRWIVPDDQVKIDEAITDVVHDHEVDALIMTGGMGLAGKDVTYEVVAMRLDKRMDGFGELFRYLLYKEIGSAASLVRALAGVVGQKVVIALPSAQSPCELAMERLVLPELAHMVQQARK